MFYPVSRAGLLLVGLKSNIIYIKHCAMYCAVVAKLPTCYFWISSNVITLNAHYSRPYLRQQCGITVHSETVFI